MVGGVSSTGGNYPYYQPSNNNQAIIQQMEEFEKELRADMGPPANVSALEALLPKIKDFMETNQQALYQIMENNGYSSTGAYNFVNEFDACINSINNFVKDPTGTGPIDLLNESITQINFYCTHKNVPPPGQFG